MHYVLARKDLVQRDLYRRVLGLLVTRVGYPIYFQSISPCDQMGYMMLWMDTGGEDTSVSVYLSGYCSEMIGYQILDCVSILSVV